MPFTNEPSRREHSLCHDFIWGGVERLEVVDEAGSDLEMILPVIAVVGQV